MSDKDSKEHTFQPGDKIIYWEPGIYEPLFGEVDSVGPYYTRLTKVAPPFTPICRTEYMYLDTPHHRHLISFYIKYFKAREKELKDTKEIIKQALTNTRPWLSNLITKTVK